MVENTDIIIRYVKKGGFADKEDILVIYNDGTTEFSSSMSGKKVYEKKIKMNLNYIHKLISLLKQIDFFSFESKYMAKIPTFDSIVYTMTFSDKERTKTVTTETEGHPPKGYKLIENELEAIIAKLTKQN